MSTPDPLSYPDGMNTEDTRITLKQAAELAGVRTRTINRWSAKELITVERGPSGSQEPATYSRLEILAAMKGRGEDNSDTSP